MMGLVTTPLSVVGATTREKVRTAPARTVGDETPGTSENSSLELCQRTVGKVLTGGAGRARRRPAFAVTGRADRSRQVDGNDAPRVIRAAVAMTKHATNEPLTVLAQAKLFASVFKA